MLRVSSVGIPASHKSAVFLRKIDALKPIMTAGILDEIRADTFYQLYRRRRELRWYVGAVEGYFAGKDRQAMVRQARMAFRKLKRERIAEEADDHG